MSKCDENKIISPIAIDFGAKYTGVYYACYERDTKLSEIRSKGEIRGEVLEWDKDYTAMLKERTAARHARRNYQRTKLAKRLLILILENYFGFAAEKHHQALGYFMNRRGFNRLEPEYSEEYLNAFPEEIWGELPPVIQEKLGTREKIAQRIKEISEENPNDFKAILEGFDKETKPVMDNLVYWGFLKQLNDAVTKKQAESEEKIKPLKKGDKLKQTSQWLVERAKKEERVTTLSDVSPEGKYAFKVLDFINEADEQTLKKLAEELPKAKFVEGEKKKYEADIWNFNYSTKFDVEAKEEDFTEPEPIQENAKKKNDYQKKIQTWKRAHLNHLAYAIYKTHHELETGGRHRSKVFEEIKEDLWKLQRDNNPPYLKELGKAVSEHPELNNIDNLYKLICHISNFELRPLRAYFNDKSTTRNNIKNKNQPGYRRRLTKHKGAANIWKDGEQPKKLWSNEKISNIFSKWVLQQWRVSEDSDGLKKVESYKKLKTQWKKHNNSQDVISFWLNIDPVLTIPPYQDQNNRRPPKCQSFVLNKEYLSEHYSKWEEWLEHIRQKKDVDAYKEKLREIVGRKNNKLLNDEQINLRSLQFILDTTKDIDPLKLNAIWSHYHLLQKSIDENKTQEKHDKTVEKIRKSIEKSELPISLKEDLRKGLNSKFQQGTFGHFLNNYYQARRKAKDGRYFIFQTKKNLWEGAKILTLCTHKPRQKKYQLGRDLANILQIDYAELQAHVDLPEGQTIENWLNKFQIENQSNKFQGLQSFCATAAKLQKEHKGYLKTNIDSARKEANEKPNKGKTGLALQAKKAENFSLKIAQDLWSEKSEEFWKTKAEKFESIHSFAQINNIVFKERNGFSKTCPVCSADNGERMQSPTSQKKHQDKTQASRLSALSIRLIDGVVMRICDKVANHVANQVWDNIHNKLDKYQVSIPLILEQNHFDYEPDLKTIKGKGGKTANKAENTSKEDRIKEDSKGICPYKGKLGDDGEIDHIIPRSSRWGTLNDEANLIYCSSIGNREKGENSYTLDNLNSTYKNEVFDETDNDKITEFIYRTLIGCDQDNEEERTKNLEEKTFIFGQYHNFSNREDDEQKSFRHALFLPEGDPLRNMVINEINNRNRAIVNGTQRYLAQIIADKLYAKAKQQEQAHRIEFDYFEYPPEEIKILRTQWENPEDSPIAEYKKKKGKEQKTPSHLIDAQLAFLLACEKHKNDGTMGIQFDHDLDTITADDIDRETGEVLEFFKYMHATHIIPKNETEKLNRDKSPDGAPDGVRLHRSFTRDGLYALNYLPILLKKEKDQVSIRIGFTWQNSFEEKNNLNKILSCLQFAKNKAIADIDVKDIHDSQALYNRLEKLIKIETSRPYLYIAWNKKKIHQFLVSQFSNKQMTDKKEWKWDDDGVIQFLVDKIRYRTERKKITSLLYEEDEVKRGKLVNKYRLDESTAEMIKKEPQTIEDALTVWDIFLDIDNGEGRDLFCKNGVTLPIHSEYKKLKKELEKEPREKEFKEFLKENQLFKNHKENKDEQNHNKHEKTSKAFSLPVLTNLGHTLQKRISWNGQEIYQVWADSDSKKDNNKFSRPVFDSEFKIKEVINLPFISAKQFKLKRPGKITFDEDVSYPQEEGVEIEVSNIPEKVDLKFEHEDLNEKYQKLLNTCREEEYKKLKKSFEEEANNKKNLSRKDSENLKEILSLIAIKELKKNVSRLIYKVENISRPSVLLTLSEECTVDNIDTLLENPFIKARSNGNKDEFINKRKKILEAAIEKGEHAIPEYSLDGFPACVKQIIQDALSKRGE